MHARHSHDIRAIEDIQQCMYINLDKRPDRKAHVESQLSLLGMVPESVTRFRAIETPGNGALGCTLSHIQCLKNARDAGRPHVLIVEDDILFVDHERFKRQFAQCMDSLRANSMNWDVIIFSGNNVGPCKRIVSESCAQISACQTTTGYLVNAHYFDALIDNFTLGYSLLQAEPAKHVIFAIDKFWFRLQDVGQWFIVTPLSVVQKCDYSDIEKRRTNYTRCMLVLHKNMAVRYY